MIQLTKVEPVVPAGFSTAKFKVRRGRRAPPFGAAALRGRKWSDCMDKDNAERVPSWHFNRASGQPITNPLAATKQIRNRRISPCRRGSRDAVTPPYKPLRTIRRIACGDRPDYMDPLDHCGSDPCVLRGKTAFAGHAPWRLTSSARSSQCGRCFPSMHAPRMPRKE